MSFLDDLIGFHVPKKVSKRGVRTPEMIAKHKATRKANALVRYREAFERFGGTATTTELAGVLNYHLSPLGQKLKALDNVEIVGTSKGPTGRPVLVWKWN